MKRNLLLFLMLVFGLGLSAQIYEQNFDGFTAGDYLAVVDADNWTTWTDAPGTDEDATISDAYSETAPNSVLVTGTTDAVYPCGDLTSGVYSVSFDYLVSSGNAGYFNLQHIFASEWAIETYLHADGSTRTMAGGQELSEATFTHDTWFHVKVFVNMNDDEAVMYWDDEEIISWQWSLKTDGSEGTNQLGCVNMYAGVESASGENPEYYFDNFVFEEEALVLYDEDFDDFTSGEYLAVVDPENWTTWSDAPGTDEDALISDDFSNTAPNAVKVDGTTDAVFPCGDPTSGEYAVIFDYYVPTGGAGYYNLQHIFASEWAVEVYIHEDGTSRIIAGGQELSTFDFPLDTWVEVGVEINMDDDVASMTWDGAEIINWQWSLKTDGSEGANQLGCVNMYAGVESASGETPLYYFDNFTFISFSSGAAPPTIELNMTEMTVVIDDGIAVTEAFNISNVGEQDLLYNVYPVYEAGDGSGSGSEEMAYCGENNDAIGSASAVVRKVAVLFLPSLVQEYIGMKISTVDLFVADQVADFSVKIWSKGSTTVPGPGEEIFSMDYTPTLGAWNTIDISEDIVLDGNPIWIGCVYFQPADTYSFGVDAGPIIPGVNWSSTGPGWSEFSLDFNWNIKAGLSGDLYNSFLEIPSNIGALSGGTNEDVIVFIDPTDLDGGQYNAEIVVASNDVNNNYVTIDVTLDVITSVNDVLAQDAVALYPNPASEMLTIKSNSNIQEVRISNYLGQLVSSQEFRNQMINVDISDLQSGVYFVEINTENGIHTIKIVKK